MTTDLETAIRDALRRRAHTLTRTELQQPDLRQVEAGTASSRGRWLAVAASVLAVLVLASSIGVIATRHGSHGKNPSGSNRLPLAVDYEWRLTTVENAHGRTEVPHSLHASLTFNRDGTVYGDDTVNGLGARYQATAGGYVPADPSTTLAGVAGADPVRMTVIDAIDGLFVTTTTSATAIPPEFEVTVRVAGDTLTLIAKGTTTTFTRDGAAPTDTPASPTPTRSGAGAPGPRPTGSLSPGTSPPG